MTKNKPKGPRDKYLEFVNIAFQMGIVIGAGVYSGIWLDRKYPNDFSGFTIGISLLGVFISLYMVIRKVMQVSKVDQYLLMKVPLLKFLARLIPFTTVL